MKLKQINEPTSSLTRFSGWSAASSALTRQREMRRSGRSFPEPLYFVVRNCAFPQQQFSINTSSVGRADRRIAA
jgi:hypothetical protein